MISTVSLLGQADDILPEHPTFRLINLETTDAFEEKVTISKIPCMYWDRSKCNPLTKIPNGHFVCIFGRIEHNPELGLYVLAEQVRHFPSNLAIHNK